MRKRKQRKANQLWAKDGSFFKERCMGLKLTVGAGDKIIMSCGAVIDIDYTTEKQAVLVFEAPKDIKIHTVFKDSSKQFKNMKRESGNS
jgi:hypothetical protein